MMIGKCLRKINQQLLSIFCILKKKKNVQLIFKKLIQVVKKNNSINDSKQRKSRMALSCSKKLATLLRGVTSKHHGDFNSLNCHHFFRT